jgi:hypothetical protein
MVARSLGIAAAIVGLLVSVGSADGRQVSSSCAASTVHYTPRGFGSLPWVEGAPAEQQLVGVLWYWPDEWRAQARTNATIYSGGTGPGGQPNMKILWIFNAPKARAALGAGQVVIKGHRLDGPGKSWQQFVAVSYHGQQGRPSYASIVDLPSPGCWRLDLTAGPLHASAVFDAISPTG